MTHRIGIVVFDGVTMLDASGPAEVFHLADPTGEAYEVVFVSAGGGDVVSSSGMVLARTISAADVGRLDTVLVAGGENLVSPGPDPAVRAAVADLAGGAERVASVCTGAFVLAELGFLGGRCATTHWRHAAELARRFPEVTVEPDVIHIRDGRYLTSAGISAGIDLALAIVEHDLGADAARAVARELVVFMQRPGGQSQFASQPRPPAHSAPLRALMAAVTADPAGEHTVPSMAARVRVSERHLNRLFRAEVGTTPARWLEEVRVDVARRLLLEGHPVTLVAQLSGLASDDTLRRAFARHLGTTPTAFRDRFATTRQAQPSVG